MARIKGNLFMMNVRGMIGKQIVVKKRGETEYLSAPPTYDENRVPTPNQQAWGIKFKKIVAYAKVAAKDPVSGPDYKAAAIKGQSGYNVAFKDARYAPKVTAITCKGYAGRVGDIIYIQATDDFRVTRVIVSIISSAGDVVEEGVAESDGVLWMYSVTRANENISGCRVIAKAYDLPQNEGVKEVTIL